MNDDQLNLLYAEVGKQTSELLSCNYSPMAIAGVMVAQAMSMYRTLLSDEEYHKMINFISDNRDNVKTFEVPKLQ
jgi:hypothetical protein